MLKKYQFIYILSFIFFSSVFAGELKPLTATGGAAVYQGDSGYQDPQGIFGNWYRFSPSSVANSGETLLVAESELGPLFDPLINNISMFSKEESLSSLSSNSDTNIREVVCYDHSFGTFTLYVKDNEISLTNNGPTQAMYFASGNDLSLPVKLSIDPSFDINQFKDIYVNGDADNIYLVFAGSKSGSPASHIYTQKFNFDTNSSKWIPDATEGLIKVPSPSQSVIRISPQVTPNGQTIFFLTEVGEGTGTAVYGWGKGHAATEPVTFADTFASSADGNFIFYIHENNLYKAPVVNDFSLIAGRSVQQLAGVAENTGYYGGSEKRLQCSADGRFVAFVSDKNLTSEAIWPSVSQIFRFDSYKAQENIALISQQNGAGTSDSFNPAISPDGRYITFATKSANLIGLENSSDYFQVMRYRADNLEMKMPTGKCLSANLDTTHDVISGHKLWITSDSRMVLTQVKEGVKYKPLLIDAFGGNQYLLNEGNSNFTYEFAMSGSGTIFTEIVNETLNWYRLENFELVTASKKQKAISGFYSLDESGEKILLLRNGSLYLWEPSLDRETEISTGCKGWVAISPAGNFAVAGGSTGGIKRFALNTSGSWEAVTAVALNGETEFYEPSLSRNGRIMAYRTSTGIKVYDFFYQQFIEADDFAGATKPQLSASGSELSFVKGGDLCRYSLVTNTVAVVEDTTGVYGFSALATDGSSVTFISDALLTDGSRAGKTDVYRYNFERENLSPNGFTTDVALSLDENGDIAFKLIVVDDYDLDLETAIFSNAGFGSLTRSQQDGFNYYYKPEKGVSGTDSFTLKVIDSSGIIADINVDITVVPPPLKFAEAFVPDVPAEAGYDMAISVAGTIELDMILRDLDVENVTVAFDDATYSDFSVVDGKLVIENITALGWEDVNVTITESDHSEYVQTLRVEYGRELVLSPGWNLVGVPYEFTEKSFYDLTADVFACWGWEMANNCYKNVDLIGENRLNSGEGYWLFVGEEKTVSLAPDRQAPALNANEEDSFFNTILSEDGWSLISPKGYGDDAERGRIGSVLWQWDATGQVYRSSNWQMTPLSGYWQFGQHGFDCDPDGAAVIEFEQGSN